MVDQHSLPDANGDSPVIKLLTTKTHIFDENLQKQLISEYEIQHHLKKTQWYKYIADEKVIMTLACGQCYEATLTKLALGAMYEVNCDAGNLVNCLE